MDTLPLLVLVIAVLAAATAVAVRLYREERTRRKEREAELERFKPIEDLEAHARGIAARAHAQFEAAAASKKEMVEARAELQTLRAKIHELDRELDMFDFGMYRPRYELGDSSKYKARLDDVRERQKELIKNDGAAVCHTTWVIEGSKARGRKATKKTLKLMLRAFNGECDATIARLTFANVTSSENRIKRAFETLNKLASERDSHITNKYLQLKLEELHLAFEYEERKREEKEEQRRIKEQMREEAREAREREKAIQEAEREEQAFEAALSQARQELAHARQEERAAMEARIAELSDQLAAVQRRKSQAELTRSGHVYVISNVGSFGEHVLKLGMTRRLEPMDRVRELGDASVPFGFDVHAMIYTEDAPTLEKELHRHFDQRRVNKVNLRREFFRVSLHEVQAAVASLHGEVEFVTTIAAEEYRKSVAMERQQETREAAE